MRLEDPIKTPFRILIIVAHPDDAEFGVGGSAAVWSDAGAEVWYVIVTDGSAGSNQKDVDLKALVAQRQAEQRAAAQVLGVRNVIFLDYKDGMLQPTLELRRDLTRIIRQFRPDRVLIMDPTGVFFSSGDSEFTSFDYINHPDHRASGEAALYAVFPSAETRPIFPELLEEGLEPHHVNELYIMMSDKPNIGVDTTSGHERKVRALLEHKSQVDERVGDMIREWDAAGGREIGVPYGETFRVMRFYSAPPETETPAT